MSDCCSSTKETTRPERQKCPVCGKECSGVSLRTILHHIQRPWTWSTDDQQYFFCDAPNCAVVYFSERGTVFTKGQLRTPVGIKERSEDAPICYCFGISRGDLSLNPELKDYVVHQTKLGRCSCETSNPSGRCCLGDFPKTGAQS